MTDRSRWALVAGLGPGLGSALCRVLGAGGYRVAGLARSSDLGRQLVSELELAGVGMDFAACDLAEPRSLDAAVDALETKLGPPDAVIYNAGRFRQQAVVDTTAEEFRGLWESNCFGAFALARRVVPGMLQRGGGCLIFVGATASVKAAAGFSAFASSKFALRGLAQSLARELGPGGIHVAHLVVDGIIWTPRTKQWPGVEETACLNSEAVAATCLHLIQQERSAWTHELGLRPDREPF